MTSEDEPSGCNPIPGVAYCIIHSMMRKRVRDMFISLFLLVILKFLTKGPAVFVVLGHKPKVTSFNGFGRVASALRNNPDLIFWA